MINKNLLHCWSFFASCELTNNQFETSNKIMKLDQQSVVILSIYWLLAYGLRCKHLK